MAPDMCRDVFANRKAAAIHDFSGVGVISVAKFNEAVVSKPIIIANDTPNKDVLSIQPDDLCPVDHPTVGSKHVVSFNIGFFNTKLRPVLVRVWLGICEPSNFLRWQAASVENFVVAGQVGLLGTIGFQAP